MNNMPMNTTTSNNTSGSASAMTNSSFPHRSILTASEVVPFTITRVTMYAGFVAFIAAALLDVAIILTFTFRTRLINPFSIHILNNAVIECLAAVTFAPGFLDRVLNYGQITHRGFAACMAIRYITWTFPIMVVLQHTIICLDRWLAILVPFWYRQKSVKFGVKVTLIACAYYHIWFLPLFIADAVRSSAGTYQQHLSCDLMETFSVYQQILRLATATLPEAFIFISTPFLIYLVRRRRRTRLNVSILPSISGLAGPSTSTVVNPVEHAGKTMTFQSELSTAFARLWRHNNSSRSDMPVVDLDHDVTNLPRPTPPTPAAVRQPSRIENESNMVLCMLIAQAVLWSPVIISSYLVHLKLPYINPVLVFSYTLWAFALLVNPVLYLFFTKAVWLEMLQQVRWLLHIPRAPP